MCLTLQDYLKPGCVFVDIGANEGFFSIIGAKLVGLTGTVIAVEPQSRLKSVLLSNCDYNDVHTIRHLAIAISDYTGFAEMHISPDTNPGSTAMWRSTRYRLPTERVETLTLAELLDRENIGYAELVKMDIEGAEYEAILGSRDLFRNGRVRALALELHPSAIRSRGLDPDAIHSFLINAGYELDKRFSNLVYRRNSHHIET